jgi:hypothetical protein
MSNRRAARTHDVTEETGTYTVSVHDHDSGKLISTFAMEEEKDQASSIEDVARKARSKLESCSFADVVIIITEETLTAFRQIQLKVPQSPGNAG